MTRAIGHDSIVLNDGYGHASRPRRIVALIMEIRADVVLAFPRDLVFATYRDRLADLTDYLPNIRKIVVLKREDREGGVELVNDWTGGGDIPTVARAVVGDKMLSWTDYATWDNGAFTCAWRNEVHAFPGAIKSSGKNQFLSDSRGTRLLIQGDLTCDASKVPGVPRLMAKTVGSAVEKFIVGQVKTNLLEIAKGVEKLLSKEACSAQ